MTLWEKRERAQNDDLFPAPAEGATVLETPPCFSWLPAPGEGSYTVVVKNRNGEVLRGDDGPVVSIEINHSHHAVLWPNLCVLLTWIATDDTRVVLSSTTDDER